MLALLLVAACKQADPDPTPAAAPPSPPPAAAPSVAAAVATPGKAGLVEGANVRPHHEEPVVDCPAQIADNADDDTRLSALLDAAKGQAPPAPRPASRPASRPPAKKKTKRRK